MYIHIYVYTFIYTCIHTYICIDIYVYADVRSSRIPSTYYFDRAPPPWPPGGSLDAAEPRLASGGFMVGILHDPKYVCIDTLTNQNPLFCRVPINFI